MIRSAPPASVCATAVIREMPGFSLCPTVSE